MSSIYGINDVNARNALNTLKRLFANAEPDLDHVKELTRRVARMFQEEVENSQNVSGTAETRARSETEPEAKVTLSKDSPEERLLKLRDYDEIERLGKGNFASFWKARNTWDDQFYAIKFIPRNALPPSQAIDSGGNKRGRDTIK